MQNYLKLQAQALVHGKLKEKNTSLPFKIYNKKLKQLYHAI